VVSGSAVRRNIIGASCTLSVRSLECLLSDKPLPFGHVTVVVANPRHPLGTFADLEDRPESTAADTEKIF